MNSKSPVLWVLGGVIAWGIIGAILLGVQLQTIGGQTGEVWNQVDRATELLPRLEKQLTYTTDQQKEVIDQITVARNNILAAKQAGDLQKATMAASQAQFSIQAIQENYPSFGLPEVQKGLLDETAGSFNRIAYARGRVIDAQVAYNKSRIIFLPCMLFFPRQSVLGEQANPAAVVPTTTLGE